MDMASVFDFSNLFVLPFWTVMILLPNWGVTRKVMESTIPFVVLALIYIFCFSTSVNPETAAALANPKLADIARFFSDENAAATGWTHFLLMDLFAGRWIYWEGQRTGVITAHSLILCLFAGPIGVLSHILTVAIRGLWLKSKGGEVELSTEGTKIGSGE
jgi:hypothetical protein